MLQAGGLPKGDALATARIAGIMAAKRTPDLVPLCHPISISGVTVDLEVGATEVRISATVRTTDRTGVEMEALTAVAVAGLTLHDMIKAVDPAAVLDAVRVERKDGGKTGTWTRPPSPPEPTHWQTPDDRVDDRPQMSGPPMTGPQPGPRTAVVIIASTRAATGVYPDRTGPIIVEWLIARGFEVGWPTGSGRTDRTSRRRCGRWWVHPARLRLPASALRASGHRRRIW